MLDFRAGAIMHAPIRFTAGLVANHEPAGETKCQKTIFSCQIIVPVFYIMWYLVVRTYASPQSWMESLQYWIILISMGFLFLRAEDFRRETGAKWQQTARLLYAVSRDRKLMENLVVRRKSVATVFGRAVGVEPIGDNLKEE